MPQDVMHIDRIEIEFAQPGDHVLVFRDRALLTAVTLAEHEQLIRYRPDPTLRQPGASAHPAVPPPIDPREAILQALADGPLRCRDLGDRLGMPNDREGVLYRELKRLIRWNLVRLHPDDIEAKKPRYQLMHPPPSRPVR